MSGWLGPRPWARADRPLTRGSLPVVALYVLIGAISAGLVRNPSRVAEGAGVFPIGVLMDQWAGAFVSLLCVVSGSVYV